MNHRPYMTRMQTINFDTNVLGSTKYIKADFSQNQLQSEHGLMQANSTSAFLAELAKTSQYLNLLKPQPIALSTSILNISDFSLLNDDPTSSLLRPREPMMIQSIQRRVIPTSNEPMRQHRVESDLSKKLKALQLKHIQQMAGANPLQRNLYRINIDMKPIQQLDHDAIVLDDEGNSCPKVMPKESVKQVEESSKQLKT